VIISTHLSLLRHHTPNSTLFPYTTLFRSEIFQTLLIESYTTYKKNSEQEYVIIASTVTSSTTFNFKLKRYLLSMKTSPYDWRFSLSINKSTCSSNSANVFW